MAWRIAQDLLALALVPVCFRLLEYAIEVSEAVGVLQEGDISTDTSVEDLTAK